MAMTKPTLEGLASKAYGPVAFGRETATFGGRDAAVLFDGDTVRIDVAIPVDWPKGSDPADVDRRVAVGIDQLALGRPELVTIRGDRASSEVAVSIWIDAERSGVPELANAVRAAVLISELSRAVVDGLALQLVAEGQIQEATREAQERFEAAQRAVDNLASRPAASAESPPAAPKARAARASKPAGNEASAGAEPAGAERKRFCTSCGAENPASGRFCVRCGGGMG